MYKYICICICICICIYICICTYGCIFLCPVILIFMCHVRVLTDFVIVKYEKQHCLNALLRIALEECSFSYFTSTSSSVHVHATIKISVA